MAVVVNKLAVDILREHLGDHVARVGEVLLLKGALPFEPLGRALAGLVGRDVLRQCLATLVQHNCVYVESTGMAAVSDDATAKEILALRDPPSRFHACQPAILQRLRFPKFVQTSKELFGGSGELVAEELLLNGCQTFQQLQSRAVEVSAAVLGSHLENDEVRAKQRLSRAFRAMAKGNFITKELTCTADVDGDGPSRMSNLNPNFVLNEEDKSFEGLWRVNYLRYNIHFRNDACARFVTEKYDETAGRVLRAMLDITEPFMRSLDEPTSSPVTPEAIADYFSKKTRRRQARGKQAVDPDDDGTQSDGDDEMMGLPPHPDLTVDAITKYLDTFSKGKVRIVAKGGGDPKTCPYEIDIGSICRAMKQRLCESIVSQKFGEHCARIFRVLLAKKLLDPKKIADIAMIPQKEAREMVYKMITANYIRIQEVPKTAQHIPSLTIYLCYVPYDEVVQLQCSEIQKAMHNLKLRAQHHNQQYRDVLARAEEALELSKDAYDALPASDKLAIEQLQIMEQQMDLAILRMDDSLLVLQSECRSEKPAELPPAKKRKL